MTCIRHMCNCVLWQQEDYAEGSESLPWKSSIPVSLSLRKKRKGRSARNSSGGIGIDLIIIMPANDIYIMMQCLSVCHKNDHFLLGVSCDHLNYP